ncbi:MAG: nucleotidyltransferase family protein, partial [Actinobacteria bacterium]
MPIRAATYLVRDPPTSPARKPAGRTTGAGCPTRNDVACTRSKPRGPPAIVNAMSWSHRTWSHRLLIACAGRDSQADWADLARVASAHGVEGWVARELRSRAEVPRDFQLQLQAAALRAAANHRERLDDAREVLELLGGAGIEAMVLKGPALVERYYRDESLRSYGDVDLFVPPIRFREALATLERGGFDLLDRNWPLLTADLRGQLHLIRPGRG